MTLALAFNSPHQQQPPGSLMKKSKQKIFSRWQNPTSPHSVMDPVEFEDDDSDRKDEDATSTTTASSCSSISCSSPPKCMSPGLRARITALGMMKDAMLDSNRKKQAAAEKMAEIVSPNKKTKPEVLTYTSVDDDNGSVPDKSGPGEKLSLASISDSLTSLVNESLSNIEGDWEAKSRVLSSPRKASRNRKRRTLTTTSNKGLSGAYTNQPQSEKPSSPRGSPGRSILEALEQEHNREEEYLLGLEPEELPVSILREPKYTEGARRKSSASVSTSTSELCEDTFHYRKSITISSCISYKIFDKRTAPRAVARLKEGTLLEFDYESTDDEDYESDFHYDCNYELELEEEDPSDDDDEEEEEEEEEYQRGQWVNNGTKDKPPSSPGRALRGVDSVVEPLPISPVFGSLRPPPLALEADSDDSSSCYEEDCYDEENEGYVSPPPLELDIDDTDDESDMFQDKCSEEEDAIALLTVRQQASEYSDEYFSEEEELSPRKCTSRSPSSPRRPRRQRPPSPRSSKRDRHRRRSSSKSRPSSSSSSEKLEPEREYETEDIQDVVNELQSLIEAERHNEEQERKRVDELEARAAATCIQAAVRGHRGRMQLYALKLQQRLVHFDDQRSRELQEVEDWKRQQFRTIRRQVEQEYDQKLQRLEFQTDSNMESIYDLQCENLGLGKAQRKLQRGCDKILKSNRLETMHSSALTLSLESESVDRAAAARSNQTWKNIEQSYQNSVAKFAAVRDDFDRMAKVEKGIHTMLDETLGKIVTQVRLSVTLHEIGMFQEVLEAASTLPDAPVVAPAACVPDEPSVASASLATITEQ